VQHLQVGQYGQRLLGRLAHGGDAVRAAALERGRGARRQPRRAVVQRERLRAARRPLHFM